MSLEEAPKCLGLCFFPMKSLCSTLGSSLNQHEVSFTIAMSAVLQVGHCAMLAVTVSTCLGEREGASPGIRLCGDLCLTLDGV